MAEPILSVRDLTKTFKLQGREDVHAVKDATFDLMPGECLGVIGESGSGKTTLVNMITGLLPATEGTVILDGIEVTKCKGKDLRRPHARHRGGIRAGGQNGKPLPGSATGLKMPNMPRTQSGALPPAEMVSPSSRKLKVFRPSSVFFVGSIAPSQPVSKQTTNRQPAISQVKVKALKALSDNGLFIRSILH